jgi:hypothetical protein
MDRFFSSFKRETVSKIEKFKELLSMTTHISGADDYQLRRFNEDGNYLFIDQLGDFVVIERESVNQICDALWSDTYGPIENISMTIN